MDLSSPAIGGIVGVAALFMLRYYGGRALSVLDRVPKEEWFDKVDKTMDSVLQLKERQDAHSDALKLGRETFGRHGERLRLLEIADAKARP